MGRLEELAEQLAERRVLPPDDQDVEQTCPFLWEMLTQDKWADGRDRVLPIVKVERISGGYRVVLQDDSLMASKRVLVSRWADILPALEKVLLDAETPWEMMTRSYRNKKGLPTPEKGTRRKKR